jgi:hypothetical protein
MCHEAAHRGERRLMEMPVYAQTRRPFGRVFLRTILMPRCLAAATSASTSFADRGQHVGVTREVRLATLHRFIDLGFETREFRRPLTVLAAVAQGTLDNIA